LQACVLDKLKLGSKFAGIHPNIDYLFFFNIIHMNIDSYFHFLESYFSLVLYVLLHDMLKHKSNYSMLLFIKRFVKISLCVAVVQQVMENGFRRKGLQITYKFTCRKQQLITFKMFRRCFNFL
jgi:hypothetical protein